MLMVEGIPRQIKDKTINIDKLSLKVRSDGGK
jgi:hypothetical protein